MGDHETSPATPFPDDASPPQTPRRWRLILALNHLHRRMLAFYFGIIGPEWAYRTMAFLARRLYHLLEPLRQQAETQCRAALRGRFPDETIPRIAEQSFVHRVWNLADLALAERYLHPATAGRFGGRIPEPHDSNLRHSRSVGQPVILLTAYYGPFDMLPILLGYQGIRAGVVYLPHLNEQFDEYRRRIRARGGCALIPVHQAAARLDRMLATGQTVAIVADHHAGPKGMPVTFLGLPTRAMRSIGLLAWRHEADIAVSGIRRVNNAFQFEITVADVIKPAHWKNEPDPVAYVTHRYLDGLERIILADPTQYLWAHTRWDQP